MDIGFGGSSTSKPTQSSSFNTNVNENNNSNGDATGFECNICFDLAQDPIVTLCGHLFCWPCLYKWLHIHSRSQDCPVCKAMVEEETLVPLYGRGKSSTDPRSKLIPEEEIPHRPTGQRPETAPQHSHNHFHHNSHGFGLAGTLGGFAAPMASARLGNFTFSAAFGGLIPSLLNLQFSDPALFGAVGGFPHRFSNPFHGVNVQGHHHRRPTGQGQQDYLLKRLLIIVFVLAFLSILWQ